MATSLNQIPADTRVRNAHMNRFLDISPVEVNFALLVRLTALR